MMEQVSGTMKAILPHENILFEVDEFANPKRMKDFELPTKSK